MLQNDPPASRCRLRSCRPHSRILLIAAVLVPAAARPAALRAQSETAPTATQSPAQPAAPPARCATPEHRQFDFWIGDWEVHDAEGALAGTNRIDPILGDCVLQENWQGAGSMSGKSFNMYSAADGKWHQTWVDDRGARLDLAGGIENGKMVLRGEAPSQKDPTRRLSHKITWEKLRGGGLLQTWEMSTDGGATWQTLFRGTYSHRG